MYVDTDFFFPETTPAICCLCGDRLVVYADQLDHVKELVSGRGVYLPICGGCWRKANGAPRLGLGTARYIRFSQDPWSGGVCFYPTEAV